MGKENNALYSVLNVLTLLKAEPKGMEQLYGYGAFYTWGHLDRTLHSCLKAGLIRKELGERTETPTGWRRKPIYYLTSLGLNFLSRYVNWQVIKVERVPMRGV